MKTFWKVTLLVIFVSGWWSLYGASRQMTFTPIQICGFYAQHKGGDKDFMGHGPGVAAQVSIQITSDKRQIKATLYLWAKETQSDYTLFESYDERIIWTAPDGYTITAINSPQQPLSRQTYTDSNHDLDHFESAEGPVSRFEIMGDKWLDDDPYMNVFFREISVQLKRGFKTGDIICLLADNNKYLSRITRTTEAIEAAKSQIDRACLFKVTVLGESALGTAFDESTIALLANNNKYLSRIPGTTEAIEAAKSQIDAYCKFKCTFLDDSTIALLADNKKYLNRTSRGSTNPIEAAKSNIDNTCKFNVKTIDNCYEDSVDSLEAHFPGIPGIKNKLGFKIVPSIEFTGGTSMFPCKHLQGMARGQSNDGTHYLFFTKNGNNNERSCKDAPNNPGELWIVKMGSRPSDGELFGSNRTSGKPPASDSLVSIFALDGKSKDSNGNTWPGWMHPGGVQLEDSVLAVALHSPYNSNIKQGGIMLIDFKDPEKPIYLKTITKFGERGFVDGVNAVGLTQICSGANRGKYLFVCGGSGGSELIFGISSGYDLRDPNLTINLFGIVTIPDSGNRIGETINLVRDRDGKIYFISFTNDDEVPNSGTDRAWLFDVVGGDGGITDVTRGRYVILDDLPSGDYGDVKAAACAYVSPSGRLILYSACHSDYCRGIIFVPTKDCREGYVKMGEFASK